MSKGGANTRSRFQGNLVVHFGESEKRRRSCTDIRASFSGFDLSSGHIEEESYTADYAKMFLGGNGFAAKMNLRLGPC